jgi:hypothetical protein
VETTGTGVSKLVFTILSAVAESRATAPAIGITEMKRDLGGTPPFGWRIGEGRVGASA